MYKSTKYLEPMVFTPPLFISKPYYSLNVTTTIPTITTREKKKMLLPIASSASTPSHRRVLSPHPDRDILYSSSICSKITVLIMVIPKLTCVLQQIHLFDTYY